MLQLDEDDLSVGAQDLSVVTLRFTTAAGRQQNHQDTSEQSSCQTLETQINVAHCFKLA